MADAEPVSASGSGPALAGATSLRWPQTCRKRQCPEVDAPSAEKSSEASDSSQESEDERGHDREVRGEDRGLASDNVSSSDDEASSGGNSPESDAAAASESPAVPVVQISKATLAMRAAAMFILGADWPVEVLKPLLAPLVTNEVVRIVIDVCNELCNQDGPALSQSFGNFDRRVAIGWLLADAAGRSLITLSRAGARSRNQGAALSSRRKGCDQRGSSEHSSGSAKSRHRPQTGPAGCRGAGSERGRRRAVSRSQPHRRNPQGGAKGGSGIRGGGP